MNAGIYALISLDGAALQPRDRAILGLSDTPSASGCCAADIAMQLVDNQLDAIRLTETPDFVCAFLGHLDEPALVADDLGLPRHLAHEALATAAFQRYANQTPHRLAGDWSLLYWNRTQRTLALVMSEFCRDQVYIATNGKQLAVSGEISRLARLHWVDAAFSPDGLALQMSRWRLRRHMSTQTPLRGVISLCPGTTEYFGSVRRTCAAQAPAEVEPWRGGFEEAVESLNSVLNEILYRQLGRYQTVAALLSGGLDSAIIACVASSACNGDQALRFLTSVAPEGSGLPDERAESLEVAQALGRPISLICPSPDASVYTPSARTFAHTERPLASPRHYLYDALHDAAVDLGVGALLDGASGEITLTGTHSRTSWRRALLGAAQRLFRNSAEDQWPQGAFHARLSPALLASLDANWHDRWNEALHKHSVVRGKLEPRVRHGSSKISMSPTSSPISELRHLEPFRNRRLFDLMASMPAHFLRQGKLDRAPGRALLKRYLPEDLCSRRVKRPISPDFNYRIVGQASKARERIGDFREAGAGDWLDLAWLDQALQQIGNHVSPPVNLAFEVQSTMIAAEYFIWWKFRL